MRAHSLATVYCALLLLACDTVDHGAWSADYPPLPGAGDPPNAQQCGAADDWVDVAAGVGVGPFDADFVTRHAAAAGSLHWDAFEAPDGTPAEVGNLRWCSGVLIGDGLFLTAGHCLEPLGVAGLQSVDAMCRHLHVDFDYQRGPGSDGPGSVAGVVVTDGHGGRPVRCAGVVDYRLDEGADHAILQLDALPDDGPPPLTLASDVAPGDALFMAHHPLGRPKVAGAGTVHADSDRRWLRYADIDTARGSSGAGVLDAQGRLVGVHVGGRCADEGGTNRALAIGALAQISDVIGERLVGAGCVDGDGDGAAVGVGCDPIDCDDDSPVRHPGAVEVCDGVDDDCDGRVDEGALNSCGACGATPLEVCNGIDDNCDGVTDEGLLNRCGACGPLPEEECNGADDDCDGVTDEGLLNRCGACGPLPEEECNGADDDCDGATDEGIGCAPDVRPIPPIPSYDEDYPGAPAGDGTDYEAPSGTVPLYSWFSPGRGDNLLTSDPRYAGRQGDVRPPDYNFSRVEGMVFDPSRPQPPGTIPLVNWYSPSRGDNFASTGRGGVIGDRSQPDYELYRIEGYVFDSPVAGTVPLVSWYSGRRGDNYATTHPLWAGAIGDARMPDYGMYRVEGYVFPAPPSVRDAARFGYGSRSASGQVPLLVIHQDMRDFPAERDAAWFEEMIFGEVRPPHPSTVALHGWWNPDARDNRVSSDPAWAGHPASEQHPEYGFSRVEGRLFDPDSAPPGTVPLYGWYSHERTDHRITSDPVWAGPIGEELGSYACRRLEGHAFDPALPQPPGTMPLWSWYSDEREDHITTTHDGWDPAGGPRGGYRFFRLEGYVLPPDGDAAAGTRPLYGWYGRFRFDNYATTSPAWAGAAASTRDGYHYVANGVRIFDPDRLQPPGTVPLNTWTRPGATYSTTRVEFPDGRPGGFAFERLAGYLYDPDRPRPPGAVPVYLYHSADRDDFLLSAAPAYNTAPPSGYARLTLEGYAIPARPPRELNLLDFYDALSDGRFGFTRGGLARIRFPGGIDEDAFGDNARLIEATAAAGIDFAAFDTDGDGRVDGSELAILVVTAGYGEGVGGQTRGLGDVRVDGVRFAPGFRVSFADARGDLNLYAHELFHTVGQGLDLYGPGAGLNARASLMAASYAEATTPGPVRLDPFHAARVGWSALPRLVAVSNTAGSAVLRPGSSPLLFFDGRRGLDEFVVLEHRDPDAEIYDRGTMHGVTAWVIQTAGDFGLELFCWDPPTNDCGERNAHSAYIRGPSGPGLQPPWRPDDGTFRLQWHDGSDVGLEFEVVRLAEGGAVVRWQPAQGFVPRLDGAVYDRDEQLMTIRGVLPKDADLVLIDGMQTQIIRRLSNRFVVFPGRRFEPGQQPIVVRYRGQDSNPLLAVDVIGDGR